MHITEKEIRALEAAIDQFQDMVEGGSEDERHETYRVTLKELLMKIKAHKHSK